MTEAPARTGQHQANHAAAAMAAGVTSELVREVTEKVYALLLADLKRERERMPVSDARSRLPGGGERR